MLDKLAILFMILFIAGNGALGGFLIVLNLRARKALKLDERMKRKAKIWSFSGSIWTGVAFAAAAFLGMLTDTETGVNPSAKAAVAISIGLVCGLFQLAGFWLMVVRLEKVVLPAMLLQEPKEAAK